MRIQVFNLSVVVQFLNNENFSGDVHNTYIYIYVYVCMQVDVVQVYRANKWVMLMCFHRVIGEGQGS